VTEPARCNVWWAELGRLRPEHVRLLDPTEQARRDQWRRPADRDRFTLGAVLVRLVAAAELGLAAAGLAVDRTCPHCGRPHGRPTLPDTGLFVSVAHSGVLVCVAASRGTPIGVDVEQVTGLDWPPLAPQVLHVAEAESIPDTQAFFRTWVRKESVLKAFGDGLGVPMSEVWLTPPTEAPELLGYLAAPAVATIADLTIASGYAAAVTALAPPPLTVCARDAGGLLQERA
jgi:4'-phosphopantetheinyl transferase